MTKTKEDKEFEKYLKELNNFIFEHKLFDEEDKDAKFEIELILYLGDVYLPKCLVSTIIDVDNLWEEFEKSYGDKERETYPDELETFILNKWKENGSVKDEEDTKANIRSFMLLLCNYGCMGTILRVIQIRDLCEEFDCNYIPEKEATKGKNIHDRMYN